MKKLLLVLLTAGLAASLLIAQIHQEVLPATAGEQVPAESEAAESTALGGDAPAVAPAGTGAGEQGSGNSGVQPPEANGGVASKEGEQGVADAGGSGGAGPSSPGVAGGAETLSHSSGSPGESAPAAPSEAAALEEPYWLADTLYGDLLARYESDALAGCVTHATITITDAGGGALAGSIRIGSRELTHSGTNAPAYDNGSGILLTPREGLPTVGMQSDRSTLCLVEQTGGLSLYEATFFFGSKRYPSAPFTAFRTYVMLEERLAAAGSENPEATGNEARDEGELGKHANAATTSKEAPGSQSVSEGDAEGSASVSSAEGRQQTEAEGAEAMPAPSEYGVLIPNPLTRDVQGLSSVVPFAVGKASALANGASAKGRLNWVANWDGVAGGWFTANITWQNLTFTTSLRCIDPARPGPESGYSLYNGSSLTGTVVSNTYASGYAYVNFSVPAPRSGFQRLAASRVPVPTEYLGSIDLLKSSASPALTDGNSCYDLSGAQYALYATWADANADTNRVHTFTTDNKGVGAPRANNLRYGTYAMREVKAPKGYELDTAVFGVEHNSTVTTVKRADRPLNDPTLMLVQKLDADTGEDHGADDPEGLLLAGAEFTVRYWDGYYDTVEEAEASGVPTRTWMVRTEPSGRAVLLPELLAEGSDLFYVSSDGNPTIPLGTVAIQETKAPPGYLLPSPNPVSLQKVEETGDHLFPITRINAATVLEEPHTVTAEKLDSNTNEPLANAEFTLYRESEPGAGNWQVVSTHVTDEFGKCVFSPVAVGSYKLDETRPHPSYASLEESGDSAHYFEITPHSTDEVQVFKNDLIQVAIEVYKKTIPLTNTALDGTEDAAANHTGLEEYLYRFGARSASNVRVDEFVVTDSLEFVTSKGYRMTTLWTGTAPAGMDFDGLMHVLYKTNKTDASEPVAFAYDPMNANPANPNNPEGRMSVSTESGWRVWQECVSTEVALRLEVADLGLAEGEYITGIRAVYGGVNKGFYTGTGWQEERDPHSFVGDRSLIQALGYTPFELRDWWYSVVATDALLTLDEMGNETVMQGSIQADLFRNWGAEEPVLTDIDRDKVETRVIETFSYEKQSLGIKPGGFFGDFSFLGLPITGDGYLLAVVALTLAFAVGIMLLALQLRKRHRHHQKEGVHHE